MKKGLDKPNPTSYNKDVPRDGTNKKMGGDRRQKGFDTMTKFDFTQKTAYTQLIARINGEPIEGDIIPDEKLVEFLESRIAQASRKSSGERKPSKAQLENVALREQIVEKMEPNREYTAAEIGELMGFSTSKASGLLRGIDPEVVKVTEGKGKKHFYSLA